MEKKLSEAMTNATAKPSFSADGIITVLVRHLGGGKFKVINDRSDESLIGKILDASEIYHC
jgi:hypothetical protein